MINPTHASTKRKITGELKHNAHNEVREGSLCVLRRHRNYCYYYYYYYCHISLIQNKPHTSLDKMLIFPMRNNTENEFPLLLQWVLMTNHKHEIIKLHRYKSLHVHHFHTTSLALSLITTNLHIFNHTKHANIQNIQSNAKLIL